LHCCLLVNILSNIFYNVIYKEASTMESYGHRGSSRTRNALVVGALIGAVAGIPASREWIVGHLPHGSASTAQRPGTTAPNVAPTSTVPEVSPTDTAPTPGVTQSAPAPKTENPTATVASKPAITARTPFFRPGKLEASGAYIPAADMSVSALRRDARTGELPNKSVINLAKVVVKGALPLQSYTGAKASGSGDYEGLASCEKGSLVLANGIGQGPAKWGLAPEVCDQGSLVGIPAANTFKSDIATNEQLQDVVGTFLAQVQAVDKRPLVLFSENGIHSDALPNGKDLWKAQ